MNKLLILLVRMPPLMHVVRIVSVTYYLTSSRVFTNVGFSEFYFFLFFYNFFPLSCSGGVAVLANSMKCKLEFWVV